MFKNCKLKIVNFSRGFTLIEVIVVITIMGILGAVFSDILVQSLRTQNKVRVLTQVKQNGQNILNGVIHEVQRSERIICADTPPNTASPNVLVLYRQGVYTRFKFVPAVKDGNGRPTSNGYITSATIDAKQLETQNLIPDDLCASGQIGGTFDLSNVNLSDKDAVGGVSLDYDGANPAFAQAGYTNEAVEVRFLARQAVNAGQTYETIVNAEGILFTTTIKLRSTGG